MREIFQVQEFVGRTDGVPSWSRVSNKNTRAAAELLIADLLAVRPQAKYRIRKIKRR